MLYEVITQFVRDSAERRDLVADADLPERLGRECELPAVVEAGRPPPQRLQIGDEPQRASYNFV